MRPKFWGKTWIVKIRTIIIVITNNDFLRLAIFAHLTPEILVEGVEMILQLAWIHLVLRIVGRVLVEVGQEDRLRVGWFDVFSRAAVTVAACADFVVEAAVDFILLGAEDGSKVAVREMQSALMLQNVQMCAGGECLLGHSFETWG